MQVHKTVVHSPDSYRAGFLLHCNCEQKKSVNQDHITQGFELKVEMYSVVPMRSHQTQHWLIFYFDFDYN